MAEYIATATIIVRKNFFCNSRFFKILIQYHPYTCNLLVNLYKFIINYKRLVVNSIKGTLENKNILVTGGCGFIGSEVTRQLSEHGANITVIDNLSSGKEEYIQKIPRVE